MQLERNMLLAVSFDSSSIAIIDSSRSIRKIKEKKN